MQTWEGPLNYTSPVVASKSSKVIFNPSGHRLKLNSKPSEREREREGLQVLVFIFRTLVIQTFTFNLGQGTGEESYGSKLFSEREYVAIQRIFWQPHLFVLCLIWWSPFPLVPICSSLVLPESHAALVTSNWEPRRKEGLVSWSTYLAASVGPVGIFLFLE